MSEAITCRPGRAERVINNNPMDIPIEIVTFMLDESQEVEALINTALDKDGIFNIKRFDNPFAFKNELKENPNVRLVLLDIKLADYEQYDMMDMIKYLHKEHSGIYIIVVAGFLDYEELTLKKAAGKGEMATVAMADARRALGRMMDFVANGVFGIVDKNGEAWQGHLKDALERVTRKVLYKIKVAQK